MINQFVKLLNYPEIVFIKNILSPYTKRAYLVGGCVRDIVLGIKNNDFDIEVYDIEPDKFNEIMISCGANGVGKQFFVYKLKDIDLSLPRKENKTGTTHRSFEVEYCNSEKEASMRRDFTMNAMMINIFTGELVDFWGGMEDIKLNQIRHIDDNKFKEDNLRVLRAVQFSARFGFDINPSTTKLMRDLSLEYLSGERIGLELMKFFNSKHPSFGIKALYQLNLFYDLFDLRLSSEMYESLIDRINESIACQSYNQYTFLYLLNDLFGVSIEILSKLRLPKHFEVCWKQKHIIDGGDLDFELLNIALTIPLKEWIGLNTFALVSRAKKLGFFDKTFKTQVHPVQLLDEGFSGKNLGIELARRKDEEIRIFLAKKI